MPGPSRKTISRLVEAVRACRAGTHATIGLIAGASSAHSERRLKDAERFVRLGESMVAQGLLVLSELAASSQERDHPGSASRSRAAAPSSADPARGLSHSARRRRRRREKRAAEGEKGDVVFGVGLSGAAVPFEPSVPGEDSFPSEAALSSAALSVALVPAASTLPARRRCCFLILKI